MRVLAWYVPLPTESSPSRVRQSVLDLWIVRHAFIGVEEPQVVSNLYRLDHALPSHPVKAVQSVEEAEE